MVTAHLSVHPQEDVLLRNIVAVEVERMEDCLAREYGILLSGSKRRRWERKILRWISRDLHRAIRAHTFPARTIQRSIDHGVFLMKSVEIRNDIRKAHSASFLPTIRTVFCI